MITFFNKHKYLLVFICLLIIVLIYFFLRQNESSKQEIIESQQNQAKYESLAPGKSTKEDVINKLGDPLKDNQNDTQFEFESSSTERPHKVTLEENVVKLIKETVTLNDKKGIPDIQNEFGETTHILYGDRSSAGFHLFVYPENGIAYIGQTQSGLLLEVWYFPPTTFEEFKSNYAPGYTLTPQQSQ